MIKWGVVLFLAGVVIAFLISPAGILLAALGIVLIFIGLAPSDYDEEEQLDTEDEINLIYYYDED